MNTHAHYFRIGVFVIAAVALGVAGIIILGGNALFQNRVLIETYIDESIQGLDVGAMVKYRGVQVGNIKEMTFVHKVYRTDTRYVMIRATIDPDLFGEKTESDIYKRMKKEIDERGLRIRWSAQGLTGTAYLELDYFDPERNPPLPIKWIPQSLYIPSAISAMGRLSGAVEQVFKMIEESNFEEILINFGVLVKNLNEQVKGANIAGLRDEAANLLKGVGETNKRIQEILAKPEFDKIPEDASAAVAGARRVIEDSQPSVAETLKSLGDASKKLERVADTLNGLVQGEAARRSMGNLAEAVDNITSASADLPETVARLNRTLRRADGLIANQQENIQAIVENLRLISQNLADLTARAKEYPSGVLFGAPPAQGAPPQQK